MKKIMISDVQHKILVLFKDFLCNEPNDMNLGQFIKQLKEFSFSIQDIDKDIGEEIFICWGYMEVIYANSLLNIEKKLSYDDLINIKSSYHKLLKYSEILISKYYPKPNDIYEWPFQEYK